MYLRELKLAGFKSFADRTHLALERGVAVVVGPNGSGKSNLVDAVAWVMGTQSPKALRTQKMDDVIFAGTATMPPRGRAEVTLVFDNEDGALPLDLGEVSITRRLYRDGTSEYLIGGMECRLTDIQELLWNSGVGRQQHTIVGQGQIDAVLSAGSEDHRAVIEEAAGVLKHRVRKERALLRLERTNADLLRLRDIERELQRQIRPLKRQAKAAERYDQLRAEVRDLRLYVDGLELSRVGDDLAGGQEEDAALDRRAHSASDARARVATALGDLEGDTSVARSDLESDTAAAARLETTKERFERIAQVAHERLRAAHGRAEQAGARHRDLLDEKQEVDSAASGDERLRHQLAVEVESATAEANSLANEERVLADQAAMPAEGVVAMLRGEISSLERAQDRDGVELSELETRMQVLAEHLEADEADCERLEGEVRSLDEAASTAGTAYAESRDRRQVTQAGFQDAEHAANAARVSLAAAEAGLAKLEQASSRLSSREIAETPGVTGRLVSLLGAPPDLVPALEAALGGWMDGVAVEPGRDLPTVVDHLRTRGFRGVPIVREPVSDPEETPAERVGPGWGLEPLTARLGPAARVALARSLLGDVLLVESWSMGWKVVTRNPDVRAVTPEGDLITGRGVALRDPERDAPHLLEQARAELETAKTEAARRDSLLTGSRRSFQSIRDEERAALEELERVEASLAGATEALGRAQRERSDRGAELSRLGARVAIVRETVKGRAEHLASLRARLRDIQDEPPERAELREDALRRRRDVSEMRRAVETQRDAGAAELAAASERLRLLEARRRVIDRELEDLAGTSTEPADIPRLGHIEETARSAWDIVAGHISELRGRQRTRRDALEDLEARQTETHLQSTNLAAEAEEIRERKSALAVRLTELRLRVESIAEGLRRDLDAAPEDALSAPEPDLEPGTAPHGRLEELEAQLLRIGPINPLASDEYRELSDRLAFLVGQLEDVESSGRKLSQLIVTLDREIAEQFGVAFSQVAKLFEEHFQLLFPGGRGHLRLTEPDDLLTSGVEIMAQPMGKKVSRLSLLSGGEKSLAALAFLFAVFRARPSPFYLLDEVEAALDDANLHRFLRLLDRVRFDAQLIIVTHQQQTMEAADVLYGMTLEPGGSTQVVSKRLVAA